jgi:hypothetical protein
MWEGEGGDGLTLGTTRIAALMVGFGVSFLWFKISNYAGSPQWNEKK